MGLSGTGCQTVHFYTQAVQGNAEIRTHGTPTAQMIGDPQTPETLRKKLELCEKLRAFAGSTLKLPAKDQYTEYVDLHRPYSLWNVFAAPEFSLEPKTWWYPFLGNLSYRGYFHEADAREVAAQLKAQGYDVFVGGIEEYSTLGWFHDPLLNTFIHHSEPLLAENLFHELTHQRYFVPGDTNFNEAFATSVGEAGAKMWLRQRGEYDLLKRYELHLRRLTELVHLFHETRAKLAALYGDVPFQEGYRASHKPRALPDDEIRARKKVLLDELDAQYRKLSSSWAKGPVKFREEDKVINNARLNSMATYYDLLPYFNRLLEKQHGDWDAYYREVEKLGKMSKADRKRVLMQQ